MASVRAALAVVVLAAVVLALVGCGQPVPAERLAYVGAWSGPDMSLLITADGRVVYRRSTGSSRTSIDAPLQAFDGDNFSAGIGPLSTTFVVSSPPRLDDGTWHMTVDGVALTRKPVPAPDGQEAGLRSRLRGGLRGGA